MHAMTESLVEEATLSWLESLGWSVRNGLEIAPGELFAERVDYGERQSDTEWDTLDEVGVGR